jgi:hypothetical protein
MISALAWTPIQPDTTTPIRAALVARLALSRLVAGSTSPKDDRAPYKPADDHANGRHRREPDPGTRTLPGSPLSDSVGRRQHGPKGNTSSRLSRGRHARVEAGVWATAWLLHRRRLPSHNSSPLTRRTRAAKTSCPRLLPSLAPSKPR